MECDYLYGWVEKRSYTLKSHPKMVNPKDIAWNAEEQKILSKSIKTFVK